MPEGAASLVYTNSKAGNCHLDSQTTNLKVDISDASPDEARWWAAVLAPGQGWQTSLVSGQDTFAAPWSVRLQPDCRFVLSTNSPYQTYSATAPSFPEALHFLDRFCVRHNIVDQSHAALAAVLLFPSMGSAQGLQLPAFTPTRLDIPAIIQHPPSLNHNLSHTWAHQTNHLDPLLTLSSHTNGIRPLLLSTFYRPSLPCNAVTPHFQGTLAALTTLPQNNPLGLQKTLLRDAGWGLIPVDLHSAVWTGTVQSFIQQDISTPLVTGPTTAADGHGQGYVSRADQCRILFLSRSGPHDRVPVCQWEPFGETAVEDCDVEVRMHVHDGGGRCEGGHGLRYRGVEWDRLDGEGRYQSNQGGRDIDMCSKILSLSIQQTVGERQYPVDYAGVDREKESASENATRNIFGWLRVGGYAVDEKEIWDHEWFEILESDEDEERSQRSNSDL